MEVTEHDTKSDKEKEEIVLHFHASINDIHQSSENTILSIRAQGYDWENLDKYVIEFCKSCIKCSKIESSERVKKLHSASLPYLWKRVHFIVLGPFSTTSPKFVTLLVDQYSLWVEGSYLYTCTPQALAQFIIFVSLRLGWSHFVCDKNESCICKLVSEHVVKFKENWDSSKNKNNSTMKPCQKENISSPVKCEKESFLCDSLELSNASHSFSITSIDDVIHWNMFGKYSYKVENLKNRIIQLMRTSPHDWEKKFELLLYKYRISSFVTETYSPFLLMYGRNPETEDVPWKDAEMVVKEIEPFQIRLKTEDNENTFESMEIALESSENNCSSAILINEVVNLNSEIVEISNKDQDSVIDLSSEQSSNILSKSSLPTCVILCETPVDQATSVVEEVSVSNSNDLTTISDEQQYKSVSEEISKNLSESLKNPILIDECSIISSTPAKLSSEETIKTLNARENKSSTVGSVKRKRGRPKRSETINKSLLATPVWEIPVIVDEILPDKMVVQNTANSSGRYSFRTKIKKKDYYGGKASVIERIHHQNSLIDNDEVIPFIAKSGLEVQQKEGQEESNQLVESNSCLVNKENDKEMEILEENKEVNKEMENKENSDENIVVSSKVNFEEEDDFGDNGNDDNDEDYEFPIKTESVHKRQSDDSNGLLFFGKRGRKLAAIKPLKCPKCCSTYVTCQDELDVHLKCHSDMDKLLHCSYCEKTCQTWSHMFRHLGQHIKRDFAKLPKAWITCPVCNKTFTSRDGLNRHKRDIHQGYFRFVCAHCDRKFKDRKTFKRHLDIHADITYRCENCKYKTKVKRNMLLHQRLHEGKAHVCELCGKGFVQQSGLNLHMISHNDNVPKVMCEHCGLQFKGIYSLRSHVYRVHSEPQNIKCPQCDYIGRNKSNLSNHINRAHNKPLSCMICSYSTDTESALRRHLDINHSEARPLPCSQCTYRAKDSKMLAEHVRNKHDPKVRRFPCQVCHVKFKSHTQLRDHMPAHTGLKPHRCRFCDYACKYRQGIHRHMRLKHPQEYSYMNPRDNYKTVVCDVTFTDADNTITENETSKDPVNNEQHILYTTVGEEIIVTSEIPGLELEENAISIETANVTLEAVQAGIAMGIIPCHEQTEKAVELLLIAMNPNDPSTIVEEVQEVVET